MALALGEVLTARPIVGVWLSLAAGCAAVAWALRGWLPPRWALLGGLLIASYGIRSGVRVAAVITLLLAAAVLITQRRGYREQAASTQAFEKVSASAILAQMPAEMKRLLVAECLVRFGEAIAAAFIVLYVTNVLGYSVRAYGTLYALQQTVSLVMYLMMCTGSSLWLTDRPSAMRPSAGSARSRCIMVGRGPRVKGAMQSEPPPPRSMSGSARPRVHRAQAG